MPCWLVLRRPATVPRTTAELGKTVWYDLSSALCAGVDRAEDAPLSRKEGKGVFSFP
jgi:hypothetical protein